MRIVYDGLCGVEDLEEVRTRDHHFIGQVERMHSWYHDLPSQGPCLRHSEHVGGVDLEVENVILLLTGANQCPLPIEKALSSPGPFIQVVLFVKAFSVKMQKNKNSEDAVHGGSDCDEDDSLSDISQQLVTLALDKMSLFDQNHDSDNLDEAINLFRDTVALFSSDDPARFQHLANLAYAVYMRSRETGHRDQLDEAISLFRETSGFRQPGEYGYIKHLDFFAQALSRRYDRLGRIEDLEESTILYRKILQHCPPDYIDRPAFINNLATSLSTHFANTDHIEDLEEAISLYRQSLTHMPTENPSRPVALHNLSRMIMSRFDRTCQKDDLDEAIELGRNSVVLAPLSHPLRDVFIASTIKKLERRFDLFDLKQDLDEEIDIHQDYLAHLSPDNPRYIPGLAALNFRLRARFERYGQTEDIDRIIECFWLTFASLPPGQVTPHIGCLIALAAELELRFKLLHLREDLDDAITVSYDALTLCPEGHPLGAHTHILCSLIRLLRVRFGQFHEREDLEELIDLGRTTITISSLQPMERFMFTNDLALDLSSRFDLSDRWDDLYDSITFHRRARDICPSNYPERFKVLLVLAIRIMTRYKVLGRTQDLQESILLHLETIALVPNDQAARAHATFLESLSDGGNILQEKLSNAETFEDALQLYSKALEELSCLSSHTFAGPKQGIHLPSTIGALMGCLLEHSRMENISETVTSFCQTLALSISTLGAHKSATIDLAKRFLEVGRSHDLDMVVSLHRDTLVLFPSGHDHHPLCLSNLAASLMLRFDQLNNIEDLNEAVDLYRKSLNSSQPSYFHYYEIEIKFVWCLLVRFGYTGDCANLIEAMTTHHKTLLHRGAHEITYIPKNSEDFILSIQNRIGQLGTAKTFEEAAEICCEAVILCSPGNPDRPHALGGALKTFDTGVETHEELLEWSKQLQEQTRETLFILSIYSSSGAVGPVISVEFLFILARIYLMQHDLDLAFSIYANCFQGGSINQGFRAALTWARLAREYHHSSNSHAYSQALLFSEKRIAMRPTVESQYKVFTSDAARELSSHAASFAIQEGDLEVAVEMLERGRGQLWSKLRTYRDPFNQFTTPPENDSNSLPEFSTNEASICENSSEGSVMESESEMTTSSEVRSLNQSSHKEMNSYRSFFKGIGSQLEDITTSTLDETFGPSSLSNVNARFERDSAPHRQLVNTWNEATTDMGRRPNLSAFLSPIPFSFLRGAAVDGPVIMISLSRYRSDALIIRDTDSPVLVPLDKDLPEIVAKLCVNLFKIKNVRLDMAESRASYPIYPIQEEMTNILRILWQKICVPVVAELQKFQIEKQSRIWWCPTGALIQLPIHAAGLMSQEKRTYTMVPEPSILSTHLLVIGQSDSLPQVRKELSILQELFSTSISSYDNAEATPDLVLSQLKQYKWVHFACHGGLNATRPFESYFKLHNGNLSLRQILRSNLPSAEFGFLAACHTMRGDVEGNPDEGISLAAAVQFSGFRSIVGTLWAMSDCDGPLLARDFYRYMLRNGPQNIKQSDAAIALHKAVESMRNAGVPVERWSTFVHVGI
ncbi:hypothetical protein K435DRAFT_968301 [Dendrothele bispora CBS 962.96]|uniref:CHAT domain-containing protein n=1 Tax=Dendrothele bispora (strain CBS 962.96) TaxID=1314807 RepID=A0A4S8LP92_DENBC|nr:hypothetical protein K435DRAFT_968301 [Dendrothele bispora CBS 962.96]